MKSKYIECDCQDVIHTIRFSYIEDDMCPELFISNHLNKFPWYRRIWVAIKYIFGYNCIYGHFEETLLNDQQVANLVDFLLEYQNREKK